MVGTIKLSVSPTESRVELISGTHNAVLTLTRKVSHAFVEALAQRARKADWPKGFSLSKWLGVAVPAGDGNEV